MKSKQSPSYRESEDLGDCLFRKKIYFHTFKVSVTETPHLHFSKIFAIITYGVKCEEL